jgi:hypothetical protein
MLIDALYSRLLEAKIRGLTAVITEDLVPVGALSRTSPTGLSTTHENKDWITSPEIAGMTFEQWQPPTKVEVNPSSKNASMYSTFIMS